MAYPIVPTEATRRAIGGYAPGVGEALVAALLKAADDPWAVPRLSERRPPEDRLLEWDDGRGFAILVIDEPEQQVHLQALAWPSNAD